MSKLSVLLEMQKAGFLVPTIYNSQFNPDKGFGPMDFPVVVRSSASVEDGNEASFAGMFESFLNLNDNESVQRAILQCADSANSDRVKQYCQEHGIDFPVEMSVIVQKQIDPIISGVAFTHNPITGEQEFMIEAVEGLGDRLLSGEADPLPDDHELMIEYRSLISCLLNDVMAYFKAPTDIEFAIADNKIYLLQARPITVRG